jgi:ferritin-like metal-binding protein YciE
LAHRLNQEATMTDPKDHVLAWLRDAHAAEEQAETMLSTMSGRLEHYPELKARIDQHISESQRQAEAVRGCLERLGSSPSAIKEAGTKLMGFAQSFSGVFTSDEVVKGVLASYAFEHMEIASYKMLIVAAREVGDTQTAQVCEQILQEEIAMAKWLEDNMESITQKFLTLERAGATAKR